MGQVLVLWVLTFWCGFAFSECESLLSSLVRQDRRAIHNEILRDLEQGQITQIQVKRINGNTHDIWQVTLHNPETQRSRQAILKPREWGDSDGWARAPMEWVAYRLNRILEMDYVPPTVYRHGLIVGERHIHETPVIFFIPHTQILYETDARLWGISKAAVQSDHRILSVLLHNSDGHYKNLLLGQHWVEDRPAPAFIDFGASLREGTSVTMRRYPALNNSEPVSQVRRRTYEALKRLSEKDLREFHQHLTEKETSEILLRRDGILSYFNRLIESEGPSAVFISE